MSALPPRLQRGPPLLRWTCHYPYFPRCGKRSANSYGAFAVSTNPAGLAAGSRWSFRDEGGTTTGNGAKRIFHPGGVADLAQACRGATTSLCHPAGVVDLIPPTHGCEARANLG